VRVPLVIAVAGTPDRLGEFGDQLAHLGLSGQVIDGSDLGHSGWLLARLEQPDDATIARVEQDLARRWDRVQVGDVTIAGQPVHGPLCRSLTQPLHEAVWSLEEDLELGIEAWVENLLIARTRRDEHVLWGRMRPIKGDEPSVGELLGSLKGHAVALWRRGPILMFAIFDRNHILVSHAWEPQWTPIGTSEVADRWSGDVDVQRVRDLLGLSEYQVHQLAAALSQGPVSDGLALLVCDALGIPSEAADVVAGRIGIEDIEGAEVLRTRSQRRARAGASDHEPASASDTGEGAKGKQIAWILLYGFALFSGTGTLIRGVADLSWWRILLGAWVVIGAAAAISELVCSRRRG
jgi:hypothetical protein